jgi:GntR family transcriptional regulator
MDTSGLRFDLLVPYDASVTVDHDSPEPLYRQVAAILRRRIASGEITARLPSLKTIAQEYGVSHITAEKAVALLREEGVVVVVVGRGAYVKKDRN